MYVTMWMNLENMLNERSQAQTGHILFDSIDSRGEQANMQRQKVD